MPRGGGGAGADAPDAAVGVELRAHGLRGGANVRAVQPCALCVPERDQVRLDDGLARAQDGAQGVAAQRGLALGDLGGGENDRLHVPGLYVLRQHVRQLDQLLRGPRHHHRPALADVVVAEPEAAVEGGVAPDAAPQQLPLQGPRRGVVSGAAEAAVPRRRGRRHHVLALQKNNSHAAYRALPRHGEPDDATAHDADVVGRGGRGTCRRELRLPRERGGG